MDGDDFKRAYEVLFHAWLYLEHEGTRIADDPNQVIIFEAFNKVREQEDCGGW